MRGTPEAILFATPQVRIIPAYAGNTAAALSRTYDVEGSSPRMRGTPFRSCSNSQRGGIIPAYAGNTERRRDRWGTPWDHPRVCGEHLRAVPSAAAFEGSSPRMRGTHNAIRDIDFVNGIIPAYAGNTYANTDGCILSGDHPRVCGEHCVRAPFSKPVPGSSPRMRGTQRLAVHVRDGTGIIPAYAGNTL